MKFKKLLISASVVAASSGLLATILTSCAKANIDKDLKIDLDKDGNYVTEIIDGNFKTAAKEALKLSTNWANFKENFAQELVYQWYKDRAKNSKGKVRNKDFNNTISRWEHSINKEYKEKVDSYKSKYGANYKFYLQNELLSKNGGTAESYKHIRLLQEIKKVFLGNVFNFNYFSRRSETEKSLYPHIFTHAANTQLNPDVLADPTEWSKLGFYARANTDFTIDSLEDLDELAKHPDGDYAIIQNYVFDRWFETEKPFFSAAALFKYAKPAQVGTAMTDIYSNKTTVPDAPNEAFPFFGTGKDDPKNGYTGQRAFWNWYQALNKGEFENSGIYGDPDQTTGLRKYNKTISIPKTYTEDSQTLLLCYGSKMFDSTDKALYTPYALAAGSLYTQIVSPTPVLEPINVIEQDNVEAAVGEVEPYPDEETNRILKLFLYTADPTSLGVTSFLDLNEIYGNVGGVDPSSTVPYHCPLFKQNDDFTDFYGNIKASTVADQNGVRFITNNIQVNLVPNPTTPKTDEDLGQPWVLELNEAGMHAQTIDGYQYVADPSRTTYKQRHDALKDVVKYRLMQALCGWDGGIISATVFGSSGDLKTYFDKNFVDIVLEMALSGAKETNIFRKLDTYVQYKDEGFFAQTCIDQKIGSSWANVKTYIDATNKADIVKGNYDTIVAANKKIYAYRTSQISNSKYNPASNTVFQNGLLAPLVAAYTDARTTGSGTNFGLTRYYSGPTYFLSLEMTLPGAATSISNFDKDALSTVLGEVRATSFIKTDIDLANPDGKTSGFDPQIKKAKKVLSNRFWFSSTIVDNTLCTYMDSNALANQIKTATYDKYPGIALKDAGFTLEQLTTGATSAAQAITSVYKAKKLLTSSDNYSSYAIPSQTDFYSVMDNAYKAVQDEKELNEGTYNDDFMNYALFEATLAYLAKDNFAKFYSALKDTMKDGERSYVAYLTKYNTYAKFAAIDELDVSNTGTLTSTGKNPYRFDPTAANVFDMYGYAGESSATGTISEEAKGDFDSYWNVINKSFNNGVTLPLGGFLGIQTASVNSLDKDSGLADAAFGTGSVSFSGSVYKTKKVDRTTATDTVAYDQGVLYPWAGAGKVETDRTKDTYYFKDIVADDGEEQSETFKYEQLDALPIARKLAKKFAMLDAPEDIRSLAEKIGHELTNKNNVFSQIADGQISFPSVDTVDFMKLKIMKELLSIDGQGAHIYANKFERLTNVELRNGMFGDFCFKKDPNEGYKLMVTQINMSDVTEERMHATYSGGKWTMVENSPLTLNEFWYILATFANNSQYQKDAMKDAIKNVLGDKKLIVHDAQLYNKFDGTWIKDWVKKPMGE